MRRTRPTLLATMLCLALAACGQPAIDPPPTTGTPKPTTLVEVVPESARCRVEGSKQSRGGKPAPLVFPPGDIGYPIAVICNAPNYFEATAVIHAPLGIGGSETPDVDLTDRLAAGAPLTVLASDQDGPVQLTILMRRSRFPYASERDAFYAEIRARHDAFWLDIRGRVASACESGAVSPSGGSSVSMPQVCRRALGNLDQQRANNLRMIEIQRRRAAFF